MRSQLRAERTQVERYRCGIGMAFLSFLPNLQRRFLEDIYNPSRSEATSLLPNFPTAPSATHPAPRRCHIRQSHTPFAIRRGTEAVDIVRLILLSTQSRPVSDDDTSLSPPFLPSFLPPSFLPPPLRTTNLPPRPRPSLPLRPQEIPHPNLPPIRHLLLVRRLIVLAGVVLHEEVGDGGAGDDEGGGAQDGEEEYSGWADVGGHLGFFAFRVFEGGGWREGGGLIMVGRIAAMGWLMATGLNAGGGVLGGGRERESERERETGVDIVGIVS